MQINSFDINKTEVTHTYNSGVKAISMQVLVINTCLLNFEYCNWIQTCNMIIILGVSSIVSLSLHGCE